METGRHGREGDLDEVPRGDEMEIAVRRRRTGISTNGDFEDMREIAKTVSRNERAHSQRHPEAMKGEVDYTIDVRSRC